MRILNYLIFLGIIGTAALVSLKLAKTSNNQQKISKIGAHKVEITSLPELSANFQKLDQKYCVRYGNPEAPLKIVEFFSFQCPHCIKLYNDDFEQIKADFIDTGMVYFEFHPVPQDISTVQALICFEMLEENEKRLFLEVLFEEAVPSEVDLMGKLMMTAMAVFKKPIEKLSDRDFLQGHHIFEEIYCFLQQEKIHAVPTVEINGKIFETEIPNYQFIRSFLKD